MFNVGMPELIVIAGIALVILGPEKFPTQAKVFLRMIREFREHWDDAKRDILNEINPVKKEFRELRRYKPEELLDKLTGETDDSANASKSADAPAPAPVATSVPESVPTTGANEVPADFEPGVTAAAEGRTEDTMWECRDDPPAPLTEEDEYRAAAALNDIRPKDGSD